MDEFAERTGKYSQRVTNQHTPLNQTTVPTESRSTQTRVSTSSGRAHGIKAQHHEGT